MLISRSSLNISPAWRGRLTWPLVIAATSLLMAPLALWVDLPVAEYCLVHGVPGELRRVLEWSELVAHGSGVAIIAAVVFVLDRGKRRSIPRLVATAYAAGLVADLVKLCVARTRPRFFEFEGGALDTFVGWLPLFGSRDEGVWLTSRLQSFPSAHTAVAVALALGLARLYPQGTRLFLVLAMLASMQRVVAGAHYPSDTLVGAALGAAIFVWSERSRWLSSLWERIECRAPAGAAEQTVSLRSA